MVDSKEIKLTELGCCKNGINFSAQSQGKIYKLLGVSDFHDNYFANFDNLETVRVNLPNEDYLLKDGDIVFVRSNGNKALVGRSLLIQNVNEKVVCSGFCIRFRPDPQCVNPFYLLFYFKSPQFRKAITALQQTNITNLSQEVLGNISVILPTRGRQNLIANILLALSRKIEANKAINDNLMQMASTAFMHYFFERTPNGKLGSIIIEHPKSNIQVGEAQNSSGNVPFFTSGDSILKWDTVLVDDRCCYLNTGGNADVKFYVGKAAYSTDTWCISGTDQLSDYLYLLLYAIKPELDKKFFQGTGLKHLQKPLLKDRPIYIPTTQELNVFNAQIMPMMTKISENTRENQRLMSIRDWLLPLLMNGQATVEA